MPIRKISPELEEEIFARALQGETNIAIAQWVARERHVNITHQGIGKFLRARREQRADVAKSVLREKLASSLCSDIDHLESIRAELCAKRKRLNRLMRDALESENYALIDVLGKQYPRIVDLEIKAIDRKLHYSGGDAPDDTAAQGLAGLFAELRRRAPLV